MTSHVDPALLEMFAAEVETHMAALNDGVLSLEQNPQQSERFEALMRAAHSIKGAARLVGLQAAVEVAHVIEDCFVAARAGKLAMTSSLVDVLLAGVDLLGRAAQYDLAPEDRVTEAQIKSIVQKIVGAATAAPPDRAAEPPTSPRESTTRAATVARASVEQTTEFHPHGALDARWASAMHHEFAVALQQHHVVVIDLSGVSEIDPLALALLSQMARHGDASFQTLRLHHVPAPFEVLLQATGLSPNCLRSAMEE